MDGEFGVTALNVTHARVNLSFENPRSYAHHNQLRRRESRVTKPLQKLKNLLTRPSQPCSELNALKVV